MLKTAYINIEPGVIKQKIFLANENDSKVQKVTCDLDDIPKYFMYVNKVDKICIDGPNSYICKIINDIKQTELDKYGKNNIEIEIGGMF